MIPDQKEAQRRERAKVTSALPVDPSDMIYCHDLFPSYPLCEVDLRGMLAGDRGRDAEVSALEAALAETKRAAAVQREGVCWAEAIIEERDRTIAALEARVERLRAARDLAIPALEESLRLEVDSWSRAGAERVRVAIAALDAALAEGES